MMVVPMVVMIVPVVIVVMTARLTYSPLRATRGRHQNLPA